MFYRQDIDGLRAIAVLAVIGFHFGYLPNGFLGVDVFFVISGYLITQIILSQLSQDSFCIINFFVRRIRRIIPLTLFVSAVALTIGAFTMLPDDLENLSQSVIATLLFCNNVLQAITTKNYWDIANEYKPLMHTWSLGIEEQYYLIYPLLFIALRKARIALIVALFLLSCFSFTLFLLPFEAYQEFYYIFFRFWELSAGGLSAVFLNLRLWHPHFLSPNFACRSLTAPEWRIFERLVKTRISIKKLLGATSAISPGVLLIVCLYAPSFVLSNSQRLVICVLITACIIISNNATTCITRLLLQNKLAVFIGKLSFSMYMWHQLLLSFARYCVFAKINSTHLFIVFVLTICASIFSYYCVERVFRDPKRISTRALFIMLICLGMLIVSVSFYIYYKAGVLKSIPELDIDEVGAERGMHAKYNYRIFEYNRDFLPNSKTKVLVIGTSFARDWANVLLESLYNDKIDLSYIDNPESHYALQARATQADVIFCSVGRLNPSARIDIPQKDWCGDLFELYGKNMWMIGTKNFGPSNGIFYNYNGGDYFEQRTLMEDGYFDSNELLRKKWGDKYIDLITPVIRREDKTVPVFTHAGKFISQDGEHFTVAGAHFFSLILENKLKVILDNN